MNDEEYCEFRWWHGLIIVLILAGCFWLMPQACIMILAPRI